MRSASKFKITDGIKLTPREEAAFIAAQVTVNNLLNSGQTNFLLLNIAELVKVNYKHVFKHESLKLSPSQIQRFQRSQFRLPYQKLKHENNPQTLFVFPFHQRNIVIHLAS